VPSAVGSRQVVEGVRRALRRAIQVEEDGAWGRGKNGARRWPVSFEGGMLGRGFGGGGGGAAKGVPRGCGGREGSSPD
jgi:hypothetical protein